MGCIADMYERNKKWLIFAIVSAFLWGMLAYGYAFFDNNMSHDSLNEFHAGILGNNIKMGSARVFTSLYRDLFRSDLTLPWLIGVLSLLWLGIAAFFVIRIFRVESKPLAFLIAGVLTVNISVSATAATYIHDLDCYMFAVMCACVSVFLWRRYAWGWLAGVFFLTTTMGIYQSDAFVAAALVIIVSILDLLNGRSFREVFANGLKAVAMALLSGALYFAAVKVRLHFAGLVLTSNDYNSIDLMFKLTPQMLPELIGQMYKLYFGWLWNSYSFYPDILVKAATLGLALAGLAAVAVGMLGRSMGIREKLLCGVLLVLLPLVASLTYVLTKGYIHQLMIYPVWLTYILALLLSDWLAQRWKGSPGLYQRLACMLMLGGILYGSVGFANGMFLRKDMEYDAYLSLMTRVADRMETCDGYVGGQTPVVVVGLPKKGTALNEIAPGFEEFQTVTGMESSDVIYINELTRYQAYFRYVLGMPVVMADYALWDQVTHAEETRQMPYFPAKGCVELRDGVLVVKLGP